MKFSKQQVISKFKEVYKREFGSLSANDEQGYVVLGLLIETLDELKSENQ